MFHIIQGGRGTGKTTRLIEKLKGLVSPGDRILYIATGMELSCIMADRIEKELNIEVVPTSCLPASAVPDAARANGAGSDIKAIAVDVPHVDYLAVIDIYLYSKSRGVPILMTADSEHYINKTLREKTWE